MTPKTMFGNLIMALALVSLGLWLLGVDHIFAKIGGGLLLIVGLLSTQGAIKWFYYYHQGRKFLKMENLPYTERQPVAESPRQTDGPSPKGPESNVSQRKSEQKKRRQQKKKERKKRQAEKRNAQAEDIHQDNYTSTAKSTHGFPACSFSYIKDQFQTLFQSGDADPRIFPSVEYIFQQAFKMKDYLEKVSEIKKVGFREDIDKKLFLGFYLLYIYSILHRHRGKNNNPTNGLIGCGMVIFGDEFQKLFEIVCARIIEQTDEQIKQNMLILGYYIMDGISLEGQNLSKEDYGGINDAVHSYFVRAVMEVSDHCRTVPSSIELSPY